MNIDEAINNTLGPIADFISSIVFFSFPAFGTQVPVIVLWLVVAGIFFTIYLRFMSFRGVKHAFELVSGKYDRPHADGEVTHFQALSAAMANTLGLGNIAGVAIAITIGGPGAVFWMVLAGLFAMATKMVECTLAVKYRTVREDGTVSGGPFYYMTKALANINKATFGKVLAVVYAVFMALTMLGIMAFQSNQATAQVVAVTGGGLHEFLDANKWMFGVLMAVMGAMVIFGGVQKIARVAAVMIPFMAVTYIVCCLIVIVYNITEVPAAIATIVTQAFNPQGVAGGMVGALLVGFQRAAFSNAAGVGDAAVAHSAVKTDRPPTEGFVASIEPLVDTVIVNVLSALAIVVTGAYLIEGLDGVQITSAAFASVAPWMVYPLTLAVFLFAFSSVLSCSYFGSKALGYLVGNSKVAENVYKTVVLLFIVVGSAMALGPVISLADSLLFSMAVLNGIALYMLVPEVRRDFKDYWARYKAGEFEADISPAYKARKARKKAGAAMASEGE